MNEESPKFQWKGEVYWRNLNRSLIVLSYAYITYNGFQQSNPFWTTMAAGGAFFALGAKEAIENHKFKSAKIVRGNDTVCKDCELPCPLAQAVDLRDETNTENTLSNELYNSLEPIGTTRTAEFKLEDDYPRKIKMKPNPDATNGYNFECKLNIE